MKDIIDFGALEERIVKVEDILSKTCKTNEERIMVLSHCLQRINNIQQEQRTRDMLTTIPSGNLIKRLMKSHLENEE